MRIGMWVRTADKRTGIVTAMEDGDVSVDLTNDDGETIGSEVLAESALRQAGLDEIPEARRPDEDAGAALGYV